MLNMLKTIPSGKINDTNNGLFLEAFGQLMYYG